ncbi:pyridoxamine 5'-phosphate oxidase family protein [Spirillospora sp. NPDC048911]|uniref:pyridoxamine 5'-phosphate oxidase family protein n=1 Tax=Spirillospora sp. NPDC048911 TaxID=3364527 RepID=UPI00371BDE92
MILGRDEMRRRVERLRVVRLATIDELGRAHVVPVLFVVDGDVFYSPTDKPSAKRSRPAKRLSHLDHDDRVTVLADFYHEDWLKAWWVRLRGTGRVIHEGPERARVAGLLDRKYRQFAGDAYLDHGGPVLAVDIKDWTGWAYTERSSDGRGWRPWRDLPWRGLSWRDLPWRRSAGQA